MLRKHLWPLLSGLACALPGGGRGDPAPVLAPGGLPEGLHVCLLVRSLPAWDAGTFQDRGSLRAVSVSHYETRVLKREQARLYPLRTIQSGVRLCRRPCKPLGPFLSFLPKINPFIAVGAVELWAIAACPSALWSMRSIVHQARQIHSLKMYRTIQQVFLTREKGRSASRRALPQSRA